MNFKDYCLDASKLLAHSATDAAAERMNRAIDISVATIRSGKSLLVCGNGGSASDAMHITGELVGRFLVERKALRAICLSSNPAVLTAWSNDYSFDTVFSRQVEGYGEAGGAILGLSTSGNSRNVVHAFEVAKKMGMSTIAMTGAGGGRLAPISDVLMDVPSRNTPEIQQVHICMYHFLCQEIEKRCLG